MLETGLYIVPGQLLDKKGLYLTNLLKDRTMGPRQIRSRPARAPS